MSGMCRNVSSGVAGYSSMPGTKMHMERFLRILIWSVYHAMAFPTFSSMKPQAFGSRIAC